MEKVNNLALKVTDLHVSYGTIVALSGVNLELPSGISCALLGMNGCGKSTFYKTLMGLVSPNSGSVEIFGTDSITARKQGWVGYVPQNEDVDIYFPITVEEVVIMGRYGFMGSRRSPKKADREAVKHALELVNLKEFGHRPIGNLSGGQRKRVFIARALAQGARILLLDEPFAGVDKGSEAMITGLLRELNSQGITILISTHDLNSVPNFCDEAVLINRVVHFFGDVHEALKPEQIIPAFTDLDPNSEFIDLRPAGLEEK